MNEDVRENLVKEIGDKERDFKEKLRMKELRRRKKER